MDVSQILAMLGSQVAQQVRTDHPNADGYVHAVGRLMGHAARWQAVGATGIRCVTRFVNPLGEHLVCDQRAIGGCVVCRRPMCLAHAMVSPRDGTGVCFGCVGDAQSAAGHAPGPASGASGPRAVPDDEGVRLGHLATLGLERGASGTAIHAAYKALAFENHPDRAQGSRKDAAKVRLSDINQAYAWLVSHPEETAA